MEYQIHGKKVFYDGSECGIYKAHHPVLRMEYAVLDMMVLVESLNTMPRENAVAAVSELRTTATEQARWTSTPQNVGFPILRQVPEPSVSIDEARPKIPNTERLCADILRALQGE